MDRTDASGRRPLLILLLGALALVVVVFRSLATALFLAAVLAMLTWPIQRWLTRKFRGRSGPAAGIIVALVILLVVGPIAGLSTFVISETVGAAQWVSQTVRSEGTRGLIAKLPDRMEAPVQRGLDRLGIGTGEVSSELQGQLAKAGGGAAAVAGAALSATGAVVFQGAMMLIALFSFLTHKEHVLAWLDEASPLGRGQTRELFSEFAQVCKSVIVSSVATALAQAVVAFIGYLIARVPHPFFFFALTFTVAFVPAAGAASVCLAAAALLLITGHPWSALFLAIYAVAIVGLVDNIIKPLLIRHDVHLHGTIVLFALLGGLAAFGAIGLLLGPLVVALFLAMLRIYRRDYRPRPASPSPVKPAPELRPS